MSQRGKPVWGDPAALTANRAGQLTAAQRKQIQRISIFDPWLRLVFGAFFLAMAATQRLGSWQFWVPLVIGVLPLISAASGLLARRRLLQAVVQPIEATLDAVKSQTATAVVATLHRQKLYMFLLDDKQKYPLPQPDQLYRFFVVFDVLRPGIVVAMEALTEALPAATAEAAEPA